ncbi:MAG: hypothetical protein M3385_11545 [Actinomycetota bacterium]|nr:hypothetical protein [Actinomycetota bacterium]
MLFYLYLSAPVVLAGAEVNAVVYYHVLDEQTPRVRGGRGAIFGSATRRNANPAKAPLQNVRTRGG